MVRTTLSGTIDIKRLVSSVWDADVRAVLASAKPVGIEREICERLAQFESVEAKVVALQVLASNARGQGDVRFGAQITFELVEAIRTLGWLGDGSPEHLKLVAANVMDLCANCMPEAGLIRDLLTCGESWASWLESQGFAEQWCSVQRSRVEACFHAGQYEAGRELLTLVSERVPLSADHPVQRRLTDKLDNLLRAADKPDTPSAPFAWIVDRSRDVLSKAGIEKSVYEPILVDDPAAGDRIRAALGLGALARDDEKLSQDIQLLREAASPFQEVSGVFEVLLSLLQNRTRQPDRVAALALQAAQIAAGYGFWEEVRTLHWLASVAQRRAGQLADAADTLAELRKDLAQRQRGIHDPMLRAALSTFQPHLHGVSAEVLFALGSSRARELFDVIEEAKARILTALTLSCPDEPIDRLNEVRKLQRQSRHRVCYLTLLADDEQTYAVAVLPDGALNSVRLAMGRGHLAAAATELSYINDGEPGSIVREAGIDPDDPFSSDYTKALSVLDPLAQWLSELVKSHALQLDDILCVSPDGPLYNLPLAALTIDGAVLIERFALSIAPCVEILSRSAASRLHTPLRGGVAISVPRSTEFDSKRYNRALYDHDAATLEKAWKSVDRVGAKAATVGSLLNADLAHKVVHVGAHGYFSVIDPLERSGVVLASDGKLPAGQGYDGRKGLLSPKLAAGLKAVGAHITLRACVLGRTTEVTSREALGMVWALFRAGAASQIAGSWNVDVVSAQALLSRFYENLAADRSVAYALRKAALSLRTARPAWAHPYHYAAFNTFGYWD